MISKTSKIVENLFKGIKRHAIHKMLDSGLVVSSLFRWSLFLRLARKDEVHTRRVAKQFDLPALDSHKSFLNPTISSDLFILAGGASVNRLSEAHWSRVRLGVSVGINFWPIHKFCPDLLTTEIDKNSRKPSAATKYLETQISRKYTANPPRILVLRPIWPPQKEMLYQLPPEFETTIYGRANLIGRNPENLEGDLSKVIRGLLKGSIPKAVLPDNGSSVVRMIFLGIIQRFENVVLIGVDQNEGPYFWTEEPIEEQYAEAARMFPRQTGEPHSTSSNANRPYSNEIFLPALARAMQRNSSTQLLLGTGDSRLYPEIPVFPW